MDDLERAFRDALRRADTEPVPVPPLNPDEIAGSRRAGWPGWLGGLAAAAAVVAVVVVGVAVWAASGRGVIPAAPAPAPQTMVEVDLYSGRENPQVALPDALTDELYQRLGEVRAEGMDPMVAPETGLGFRGFIVQPADDSRPALRIQFGLVTLEDGGEVLADTGGRLYTMVLDAIRGDLPPEVAEAVDASGIQVRIRNAGEVALDDVRVTFPDNQVIDIGPLGVGAASDYHQVALAYRYTLIIATVDGKEHRWQPIDFVGETPLGPGRYTYAISVAGDQIDLQFIEDDPAPTTGPPDQTPAEPPQSQAPDDPAIPGDTATWVLTNPDAVSPGSTSLALGVTRLGCSNGVTGVVLDPVIDLTEEQVIIQAYVEPLPPDGMYTCPGNDTVEVVASLPEPLGDRELVDRACLAGEAVGTSFCSAGPVRWSP